MKKVTLTYEEIELLQYILRMEEEWFINEVMQEKIDRLKLKLTAMRAQSEYLKARES